MKKNIVVIMTDDQGYGDLSCMGATDFQTPNLDRLAKEGARFKCWYSNSPVCSPSRAALLTGKYPGNAGVRAILDGHRRATGLSKEIPTLPKILKERLGYFTAMSGKWHLGLSDGCRPQDHGFDKWFGFLAGCVDFFSHIFYWGMNKEGPGINPTHDLWVNNKEIWKNGEYLTEVITEYALNSIREAKKEEKPFFLYIPYNAPHYPMHAPQKYMDRFSNLSWDRQVMAAMISAVDDGIGEIQNEIIRMGFYENTITFFTSDNGPSRESRNWLDGNLDPYYGGSSGGFKGHKFSLFEGGIRVPGIVHYPGTVPSGKVIEEPFCSFDMMPTICEWLDLDISDIKIDGTSQAGFLEGKEQSVKRDLFWEMNEQTSIRRDDWKLVINGQIVEGMPDLDDIFLANLAQDPSETKNLSKEKPDLTMELKKVAELWRSELEMNWEKYFKNLKHGTT